MEAGAGQQELHLRQQSSDSCSRKVEKIDAKEKFRQRQDGSKSGNHSVQILNQVLFFSYFIAFFIYFCIIFYGWKPSILLTLV